MPEAFRQHLDEALGVLLAEVPELAGALAEAVGERVIEIRVDGAPFTVAVGERGVAVSERAPADAYGAASRETIDSLLRGEATVEEAVLDGRVVLRGSLEDLVALDRALRLFVQCAVRAPSIRSVLRSWNEQGENR